MEIWQEKLIHTYKTIKITEKDKELIFDKFINLVSEIESYIKIDIKRGRRIEVTIEDIYTMILKVGIPRSEISIEVYDIGEITYTIYKEDGKNKYKYYSHNQEIIDDYYGEFKGVDLNHNEILNNLMNLAVKLLIE